MRSAVTLCPDSTRSRIISDPLSKMAAAPDLLEDGVVVLEDADVPIVEDGAVEQVLCDECGNGLAVLFCRKCSVICEDCVTLHQKLRLFRDHEIISLAEIAKERAHLPPHPPPTCGTHEGSPVTKFCVKCNALFCVKCTNHEPHAQETRSVAEYAPEVRQELVDRVKGLEERVAELEKVEQEIQVTVDNVEQQKEALPREISEAFKTAHDLLKEREAALIQKVPKLAESKMNVLGKQKEKLFEAITALKKVVDITNQQVGGVTNEGLVEMAVRKKKELQDTLKNHDQLQMTPVAVADLSFSLHLDVDKLGVVFCLNKPMIIRQIPEVPHVFESAEVHFRIQSPDGGFDACRDVEAVLTSAADPGSVIRAKIVFHSQEDNVYKAEFVPNIRGRHTLTITTSNQQVNNEEKIDIFVRCHPSRFRKPVHKFSGFDYPWGITVTAQDQLLVADRDNNQLVIVDRKSGQKKKTMSMSKPHGVTVTADGTVYACHKHSVEKFSADGKHMKTIGRNGTDPLEFNDPKSIKAIGNELYVCDTCNGRVQILDSDGNYLRQFPTPDCNGPHDICFVEGVLYVVGNSDTRICVYSMKGGLVKKLEVQGCPVQLSSLYGVSVDHHGYIFVTENGGGKEGVYVFKPSGEYVARFGLRSEDMIHNVGGLAIDRDGFVYVCETSPSNLWVF